MKRPSLPPLIKELLKQGKEWVVIEPEPGLDGAQLRAAIVELLDFEYLIDIRIARLPMCFCEDAFNHFDNEPSKDKEKNCECVRCRFNFFCHGFFPEAEGYVKAVPDLPKEIVIEVTDRCNLGCSYCFNKFEYRLGGRNRRRDMSRGQVQGIIQGVWDMGVRIVRFSGGEPLLRRDLFELMHFAKGLGLRVWLNTNGTMVDESAYDKLKGVVENVLIPLSGFDQKSDAAETGMPDSFERKLGAIKQLNKDCLVRAGVVLTPENAANLERFYRLADSLALRVLEFYRPIAVGGRPGYLRSAVKDISALNLKHNRNFKIANAFPFCFHSGIAKIGLGGIYDDGATRIVVDSSGMLKPSYYLPLPMGDAKQLWAAWSSEEWRGIRELKQIPEECTGCVHPFVCRGGSRALGMLSTGAINGRDPLMRNPVKARGRGSRAQSS